MLKTFRSLPNPTLYILHHGQRRFSILCYHLNFPFCICRLFGRFSSVLSFLCVTTPNHSRQTSYIILQKNVIFWSMGPFRWMVSKKKAPGLSLSCSYRITLGMSPGFCRSAMGSRTLWECSWFISPSFVLHRAHQHVLWICNLHKLLNSLPQSHMARYIYLYICIYMCVCVCICICVCVCLCIYA